jgi:hypothetical protein
MIDKRVDKAVVWLSLCIALVCGIGGYFLWQNIIPAFLAFITVFLFVLSIYNYATWGLKWRGMVFGIYGPREEDEEYEEYMEKHVDAQARVKK